MSESRAGLSHAATPNRLIPDLPLVVWMVLLALALGLAGGFDAAELVGAFNTGFGRALGEFALILLPSFTLAAAQSRRNIASDAAGRTAAWASPIAGAGMICPDTAYAALSPAAGRHKLTVAFGAYAGFKLLYPAGPLIVAAGLGHAVLDQTSPISLLLFGLVLTLPVWLAGLAWVRLVHGPAERPEAHNRADARGGRLWVVFAPFFVMAGLLGLGALIGETGLGLIDVLLLPKGALFCAAIVALAQTPARDRRSCLDAGVRRTGSLLLLIGAASAFGAILTQLVPLGDHLPQGSGMTTLVALFLLTVAFKLAQGSSMATFAAVAPVAGPVVVSSGVDPVLAVFAICLGSFIAILPNDSYYWLVRGDAMERDSNEGAVIRTLAGATLVQAAAGLALLLIWSTFVM